MSSSNRVKITAIKETTYGETPAVGNFSTARFTGESLSGSPETTESQTIRADRFSSGQVVTGLTLGGGVNFEMAKDTLFDQFLESVANNSWVAPTAVTVVLTIDTVAGTIVRASGDFAVGTAVGDVLTLAGFSSAANNVQVMITEITSATSIKYAGPITMVDEVGVGTSFKVADYLTIGTTPISFSMQKEFQDLTNKAIVYKGMVADTMAINVPFGEIVNGSVGFVGNGYDPVDAAVDFITNTRTVNAAGTTDSMNGSVDMPFLIISSSGDLEKAGFCIQSINLNINNNNTAQNCLGLVAPKSYNAGTAGIEVSLSAYLANANWNLLDKKISQESFSLGFIVKNAGGFYGFFLPKIQVTLDDPASAGINQDVILSMTGTGSVGSAGQSPIKIFKS